MHIGYLTGILSNTVTINEYVSPCLYIHKHYYVGIKLCKLKAHHMYERRAKLRPIKSITCMCLLICAC